MFIKYLFTKTPFVFLIHSFWRDEAFSYLLAKKSIAEILTLTAQDFHPPLYYLLLHFWMLLFGTTEVALRSLSLIFFLGTIYVSFKIFNGIFQMKPWKSLLYLTFIAINPLLNHYAFETRMYSLFAFLTTLSFYALYKKKTKLYVITAALGLYTQYFMVFILFAQAIWLILKNKNRWKSVINALQPLLVVGVLFAPWVIFAITKKNTGTESFWIHKVTDADIWYMFSVIYTSYEKIFGEYFYNKLGYTSSLNNIAWILYAIVGIAFGAFIYRTLKTKKVAVPEVGLMIFLWAVVPIVIAFYISYTKPVFLPRYLICSTIGLVLLLVYSLEKMPWHIRLVMITMLLIVTWNYNQLNLIYRGRKDFVSMANEIKGLAGPKDLIYVTDILDFHTAEYYFGEDRVFIYNTNYADIPSYVGKILIPKNKIVRSLPHFPQKVFIIRWGPTFEVKMQM